MTTYREILKDVFVVRNKSDNKIIGITDGNNNGSPGIRTMKWSDRLTQSLQNNDQVIFDDVGENGSLYIYRNGIYKPIGKPILARKARSVSLIAAFAAADASTYSQTGTLITITWTGHGLTNAYDGSSLYIPFASGLAASGKYEGLTYIDENTLTVNSTVSQTTSGNIATNLVETVIESAVVLGGLMGRNGSLNLNISTLHDATASAKSYKVKFGSKIIAAPAPTSTSGTKWILRFNNNGAENQQICFATGSASTSAVSYSLAGGTGVNSKSTENTTADMTVSVSVTLLADSWAGISDFSLELDT